MILGRAFAAAATSMLLCGGSWVGAGSFADTSPSGPAPASEASMHPPRAAVHPLETWLAAHSSRPACCGPATPGHSWFLRIHFTGERRVTAAGWTGERPAGHDCLLGELRTWKYDALPVPAELRLRLHAAGH